MDLLTNLLTKNKKEIPLLWVDFNYNKFKKYGKEKSCMAHLHPLLKDDEHIKEELNYIIDYIRNRYDMGEM